MNACLKDDKLIRLSTLAEQTGISVHCIRTYIDRGLIQVNDRAAGGMFLFYEPVIGWFLLLQNQHTSHPCE